MGMVDSLPCLIRVMATKTNYAGPESKIKFNSMYGTLVCMSKDLSQQMLSNYSLVSHNYTLLLQNAFFP